MTSNPAEGIWKTFRFRMVTKQDHPNVLKLLRDFFYFDAFYRIGYTKEMDDEMEAFFQAVLNDGHNLHFLAECVETGRIAAVRIITLEEPDKQINWNETPLQNRIAQGLARWYFEQLASINIPARYGHYAFPHLFGVCTDPAFRQMGLATEIYSRAKGLLKSRGFRFALCAFISPYSRAAGNKNGFIQLAKGFLLEAKDDKGDVLYPEADPEDYQDMGVFEF